MTIKEIQRIAGVQAVLNSGKPGKSLVIIGGIHGNETCGIEAIKRMLISAPKILQGSVTFVLGNLRAIDRGVRFTEQNLNRLFRNDKDLSTEQKASYEYARSRELMPLLASADGVLDIHSSGTKDSPPFVIFDSGSADIVRLLPFPIASYGWDNLEPGATEAFVSSAGGVGLCVECGYHNDAKAADRAIEAIKIFLAQMGAIDAAIPASIISKQRIIEVRDIHKTRNNFTPVRPFDDFETVVKGTLIGTDAGEEVKAPYDGVVIFVRERKNPNEEACIFGKEVIAQKGRGRGGVR